MELTGVVAQVFMTWWDKELQRKLNQINFQLRMHQRYVDDTNVAAKQSEIGARYDGEKVVINDASIAEDAGVPPDERTMRLLQQVASSIHPSIRLTIDYPSKNPDGKVAMLDLKMWITEIDGVKRLVHEHYEKDMASKMVVHARSSLSEKTKRTILTQEVLRILLNSSKYLPWESICSKVNIFMQKMQYSGYSQAVRFNVVNSALHAIEVIEKKEESGVRPRNRPKEWKRMEREEEKRQKRCNWYRKSGFDSVLFVPSTPEGKLKTMYQKEIVQSGFRIKVVETTGATLKRQLQTSNPFKKKQCGRLQCFVCTSGGSGDCNTEGITYKIECKGNCSTKNIYNCESSENGFTCRLKHITDLAAHNESNSPLWRHCKEVRGGEMQRFRMSITGNFRNDPMLRQISEAIQIESTPPELLMNTRSEWNMTRVPRAIVN